MAVKIRTAKSNLELKAIREKTARIDKMMDLAMRKKSLELAKEWIQKYSALDAEASKKPEDGNTSEEEDEAV